MKTYLINIMTVFTQFLFTYVFTVFGGFFAGMFCIELCEADIGVLAGIAGVLSMGIAMLFREKMISEAKEQEEK